MNINIWINIILFVIGAIIGQLIFTTNENRKLKQEIMRIKKLLK